MLSAAVKELQAAKSKIATQISGLEKEASKIDNAIRALSGLSVGGGAVAKPGKSARKYKMSPAHRRALIKAQKARWANIKAKKEGKAPTVKPAKRKRTMSAAARAKLSAFHKARWAKIKAAKAAKK